MELIVLGVCRFNGSYERQLTVGKEYECSLTEGMIPLSPLADFTGDDGRQHVCHAIRFTKDDVSLEDIYFKHRREKANENIRKN